MLFNSFQFLLFFPLVTAVYFLLPHRFRWIHLLAASCVFYVAFIPVYIFVLFFLIIVDYCAGLWIETASGRRRKTFLVISILANLGVLVFFKYYNFFTASIQELLQHWHIVTHDLPLLNFILPVGLSFHTFQAMSYTIEVYRGNQKAERHFGIYALYVMFYPQLAAGPIERPQHMLHQFYERHYFNADDIAKGLRMMLWGLFMKVVVADRLGIYVNAVYNNSGEHNGTSLFLATFFFSFQVYGDFAGYSLIAVGSAKTMGFDLMTNFKRPYFATSASQFWVRWHISLSAWFRDYVYIPLGGNRNGTGKMYFNLLLVYLLIGFWHGANWTYLVWGGINGVFVIVGLMINRKFPLLTAPMKNGPGKWLIVVPRLLIMLTVFFFSRIFFRATSVEQGWQIIKTILFEPGALFIPHGYSELIYCWAALIILFVVEYHQEFLPKERSWLNNRNVFVRYAAYSMLVMVILLFGVFEGNQFIYFQF